MMLLSFHIVSITLLIAVVGSIAYQMGKKRGIEIMQIEYEELQQDSTPENPPSSPSPTLS